MITFFTTAKKFEGETRNNQLNAIRSWLILHPAVEVILFQSPHGIDPAMIDPRIKIDPFPECVNNIPRIDYMFQFVSKHAANSYCCFINCDIVLTSDFLNVIMNRLSALKNDFLAVGQRWDFENIQGEWQFTEGWQDKYLGNPAMQLHPPAGSDYFLFPKGLYPSGSIPPLIVGRPGWDLWMIYNARKRKICTVDLSGVFMLYHQNHDYSHKNVHYENNLDEPEAIRNLSFLPASGKYEFTLLACDYAFDEKGKMVKNYARWMMERYLRISAALGQHRTIAWMRYRFAQILYRVFGLR
ncbi:MAG: hypothetical protein IT233_10335 [Bacteroidia bacterium]|nr:hypothetical protein [Bacteroidia bacterium]